MQNCIFLGSLETVTYVYPAQCAVQRFVLSHELIQENFKGVNPHSDRRLAPVPLFLSHGLLQDVLKQSIEIFIADTFTIIHLGRKTQSPRKNTVDSLSVHFGKDVQVKNIQSNYEVLQDDILFELLLITNFHF